MASVVEPDLDNMVTWVPYKCPKCGWRIWFNDLQLKHKSLRGHCPDCGKVYTLKRPPQLEEQINKEQQSYNVGGLKYQLLTILKDCGYSVREAKQRINSTFKEGETLDNLVTRAIQFQVS